MRTGLLMLAIAGLAAPGWCELDWVENPDNAHLYSCWDQVGTWWSAQAAIDDYNTAAGANAHLVTFCSAEEENWVKCQFGTASSRWIGFTDCDQFAHEGCWVWVNGEPIEYTNWYVGEPNNLGGEDFAMMNWHGCWNDGKGTSALSAIFELDAAPGATQDETPEPCAWVLLAGAAGLGGIARRRRQRDS